MCGIFGSIGKNWNLGVIRALTIQNENRGSDSLGFFDSSGKMIKSACTPSDGLRQKNISCWLERSKAETWFVAGHTRLATRGVVNRRNSHPFRFGRIIGSHNGVIDAPVGYVVDSQYLFDTLAKAKGDYNEAWKSICGYWAVSYFDGNYFYLQVHHGELSYCQYRGCWYYSSSAKHLESCVGHNTTIKQLSEGETLRFSSDGTVETLLPFVSNSPEYWGKKYGCSNQSDWWDANKANRTVKWDTNHNYDNTNVKEFDADWREAWASYTGGTNDTDDMQRG